MVSKLCFILESPADLAKVQILTQCVRGGTQESAFPLSSQGMPMLLLSGPHFKQQCLKTASSQIWECLGVTWGANKNKDSWFPPTESLSDSGLGELSHSNGPNYHYICSLPLSAHGWWDMEKHVTQELGQITSFETLEFVSRSPESCIRDLLWFI